MINLLKFRIFVLYFLLVVYTSDMDFYSRVSIMAAEWTDDNTRIVTELFAEQVNMGNRPNTHLTPNAYEEVANQFKIRTGLEYKREQFKNKWDKLKIDYNIFKKLRLRETGAGWDFERNTVKQDDEWWKKAKKVSSHAYF